MPEISNIYTWNSHIEIFCTILTILYNYHILIKNIKQIQFEKACSSLIIHEEEVLSISCYTIHVSLTSEAYKLPYPNHNLPVFTFTHYVFQLNNNNKKISFFRWELETKWWPSVLLFFSSEMRSRYIAQDCLKHGVLLSLSLKYRAYATTWLHFSFASNLEMNPGVFIF